MDKQQVYQFIRNIKNNLLMLFAFISIIASIIFTFKLGHTEDLPANKIALPPLSPYQYNIAAIGIVEANSRNVRIGAFTSGIVSEIYVVEGDKVK